MRGIFDPSLIVGGLDQKVPKMTEQLIPGFRARKMGFSLETNDHLEIRNSVFGVRNNKIWWEEDVSFCDCQKGRRGEIC